MKYSTDVLSRIIGTDDNVSIWEKGSMMTYDEFGKLLEEKIEYVESLEEDSEAIILCSPVCKVMLAFCADYLPNTNTKPSNGIFQAGTFAGRSVFINPFEAMCDCVIMTTKGNTYKIFVVEDD